jgi:hypothetical protein
MRDLPAGATLLALARDVLLNELLPQLPAGSHLDARLVATTIAIAEREAAAGRGSLQDIIRRLHILYGESFEPGPPHEDPAAGDRDNGDASPTMDPWRRFARDLRAGAFEGGQLRDREAREILWRLTLAKLRQANPRFLAANGFD